MKYRSLKTALFPCLFAFLFAPCRVSAEEVLARITVEGGKHIRIDAPVSISLDPLPIPLDAGLRLEEIRGSKRIPTPIQLDPGYAPRLWWILSGTSVPGKKRVYELVKGRAEEAGAVQVRQDEKKLDIMVKGGKILRYLHARVPPPQGADKRYTRSGFIHPLWSPAGEMLTRIHPPDHYHHIGIWNPWTATEFEGRKVDFWNLKKGEGTVRFVKFLSKTNGPVFGGFRALHEHVNLNAPGGEKVALNEVWDVRAWNLGGPDEGYWLVDFTFTQNCASESPLHLKKYRYGGFGFRATEKWKEGNCDYLTSEGKNRKNGHATRARWCMTFGPTDKGPAGILFLSHPHNHEHPEPMRIWPSGDVFFNFCPVQAADWILEPGNDYCLRYRLFVYNGTMIPERAERIWQDFAHPPRIQVERMEP